MKTFIILPTYNESERILEVLKKILATSREAGIVVVDDGSVDDTYTKIKEEFGDNNRVTILRHKINKGKSVAMKTGVEWAKNNMAETIIFIDADGQHNPEHLKTFLDLLKKYEIVFGYREIGKNMPLIRRGVNVFAKWLIKMIFEIERKDLLCGFFGFRMNIYDKIKWESKRYGVETEIAIYTSKNKINFCETKIDTIYMKGRKGATVFDGLRTLKKLPKWYLKFKQR